MKSAATTDVVFLVGLAPSSLAPFSVAEMHLYAYLANLVALNQGEPVSDWGYHFAVTTDGFPFAFELADAADNLIRRSVVNVEGAALKPEDGRFAVEFDLLNSLRQSARRKPWLAGALACTLHLPLGAVRDAINHSPGLATSLRYGRPTVLLKEAQVEEIYEELKLVKNVLGEEANDFLQPVVLWLSARVLSNSKP